MQAAQKVTLHDVGIRNTLNITYTFVDNKNLERMEPIFRTK